MTSILVGAADGVHTFGDGAHTLERVGWAEDRPGAVTALARAGSERWAIVDRHEVWRSDGDEWSHVVQSVNLELHCLADTRAGMLLGTAEAHLARVVAPPNPLESVESFDRVEGRDRWYTPWGGPPDSRSISEDDDGLYVNVHVGGIVRSRDEGATWEPTIDVDADVHRVWAGDAGVFAACARGLAVSHDGGETWETRRDGLHAPYCRGVTVSGDTVLLSASLGPRGGRAAVYRGGVSGGPLERCATGLPEWFEGNIDSAWLDATSELAAFASADGRVFASGDEGVTWGEVASGLERVGAVLVVP
ncbi:MAG TPA: sialidase family protein [Actinomycetota bacterium]|nr:sialidase family protein [Actinomycetota bacterium]